MQSALRRLRDPLMAERKFQRKPEQRDDNEVSPARRRRCAPKIGPPRRQKSITQYQGSQRNTEGIQMGCDRQKQRGQYSWNRKQWTCFYQAWAPRISI